MNINVIIVVSLLQLFITADTTPFEVDLIFEPNTISTEAVIYYKLFTTPRVINQGIHVGDWTTSYDAFYRREPRPRFEISLYVDKGSVTTNYVSSVDDGKIQSVVYDVMYSNLDEEMWFTFSDKHFKTPPYPMEYSFCISRNIDYSEKCVDVKFVGQVITTASITLDSNQCVKTGSYTFDMECPLDQVRDGQIYIELPDYYKSLNLVEDESKLSLTNIVGFNPNANIVLRNNNLIVINNPFNSDEYLSSRHISFTINNLRHPYSTRPLTGFKVGFQHFYPGTSYYQFTDTLTVKCDVPSEFALVSATSDKYEVNSVSALTFSFKTDYFVPITGMLEVIVPLELVISSTYLKVVTGRNGIIGNPSYTVLEGQKIRIPRAFEQDYFEDIVHSLFINSAKLPRTTQKTLSFKAYVYDSSGDDKGLMYAVESGITIQTVEGPLGVLEMCQYDKHINKRTSLNMTLNFTNYLLPDEYITIELPDGVSAINRESSPCSADQSRFYGVSQDVRCVVTNNKHILIENGFPTGISASDKVFLIIDDIINGYSTKPTKPLIIRSHAVNGYYIDKNPNMTLDFLPGNIDTIVLDRHKSITNYEETDFTLSFIMNEPFYEDGAISLLFPDTISFEPQAVFYINGNEISSTTIEYDNTVNPLLITFRNINPTTKYDSGTNITVYFAKGRNPRTNAQPQAVNITTYTNDSYIIETTTTTTMQWTINTLARYISPELIINTHITGETATYTFKFTTPTPIVVGDIMLIYLDNKINILNPAMPVKVTGISSCGSLSYDLQIIKIDNTALENYTIVRLALSFMSNKSSINKDEVVEISLHNVVNPISTRPTLHSMLRIETTEGNGVSDWNDETFVIEMTTPHDLLEANIEAELTTINVVSDYIVEFTTFNAVNVGDYIVIIYPQEINIETHVCEIEVIGETISEAFECVLNENERNITIKNAFNEDSSKSKVVQVKIKNMKSTLASGKYKTSSFEIYIYDKEWYSKERKINQLEVLYTCAYPCSTCGDQPDYCTKCLLSSTTPYLLEGSCYTTCPYGYSPDIVTKTCIKCTTPTCAECDLTNTALCTKCAGNYPYLLLSTSTCETQCPIGTYVDADNKCQPCSSPCATCIESSTKCTSCDTSSSSLYPYLYEHTCLTECPNHSIKNQYECLNCDSSCKTCENTINTCTSCNTPLLLYNSKCIGRDECTSDNNYYQDTINNKCLQCQDGCIICGNSITECVECNASTHVLKNGKCLQKQTTCEPSFYLTQDKLCEACDTTLCKTCESASTLCTSCQGELLLENTKCVAQCSNGYFLNTDKTKCVRCTTATCEKCTVDDRCISCIDDLALKTDDGTCITKSECDSIEGYFIYDLLNNKYECKQCLVDNCYKCNSSSEIKCSKCNEGFYIYNDRCVGKCPSGYTVDIASQMCLKSNTIIEVSKINLINNYIFRFPKDYYTIIAIMCIGVICLVIQKCCNEIMLYLANTITYLSIVFKVVLVLIYVYTLFTGMKVLFYFYALAFMFHVLLNCAFIVVLAFHTIKDEEFYYWKTYNTCSYWLYIVMMFIFDYKVIRCYYGRLTNAKVFNMKFKDYKLIHRPYKVIAIFDMVVVHLISIAISIYIMITYKLFSFVFWLALYCVVASTFLVVCVVMDMVSVPDVNLDFYNQKKPKPDIIPVNIQDKPVGLSVVNVDNSNNNGKDNSSVNANSQNIMMNSRRGLNTSRTGSNLTSNMLIKSGRDDNDNECGEKTVNEEEEGDEGNENENENEGECNDNIDFNDNNDRYGYDDNNGNYNGEEVTNVIKSPEKKPTFGMMNFVSFGNKGKFIDNNNNNKNNIHDVRIGKFNNNYKTDYINDNNNNNNNNNRIDEESIEANEMASKPQSKPSNPSNPPSNSNNNNNNINNINISRISKLNRSQTIHNTSYYFPSEDEDEIPKTYNNQLNDQSININID